MFLGLYTKFFAAPIDLLLTPRGEKAAGCDNQPHKLSQPTAGQCETSFC